MAIKGKGKTRARQAVRAPRRGPVPVPVPFVRRRGVQLVAAFLVGLLVFWGGVWLTNGLREQDRSERGAEEELLKRRAGSAWEDLVATEVGAIGTVEPGRPPVVLPQVRAAVTGLADETPKGAVETLRTAAAEAGDAIGGIEEYQLAGSLADKGFDQAAVLRYLSARDELVAAIELYREAALLGVLAADLEGAARREVLERSEALLTNADTALVRFQTHQSQALTAAGIIQQPTLPGS